MSSTVQVTFDNKCGIVKMETVSGPKPSPVPEKVLQFAKPAFAGDSNAALPKQAHKEIKPVLGKEDLQGLLKEGIAKNEALRKKHLMKWIGLFVARIALGVLGISMCLGSILGSIILAAHFGLPGVAVSIPVAGILMLIGCGLFASVWPHECLDQKMTDLSLSRRKLAEQNTHFQDPRFAQILAKVKPEERESKMFADSFHQFFQIKMELGEMDPLCAESVKQRDEKKKELQDWKKENEGASAEKKQLHEAALQAQIGELEVKVAQEQKNWKQKKGGMNALIKKNPDLSDLLADITK